MEQIQTCLSRSRPGSIDCSRLIPQTHLQYRAQELLSCSLSENTKKLYMTAVHQFNLFCHAYERNQTWPPNPNALIHFVRISHLNNSHQAQSKHILQEYHIIAESGVFWIQQNHLYYKRYWSDLVV